MNDSEGVKCTQKHWDSDDAAIYFHQFFSNDIEYNVHGKVYIFWTVNVRSVLCVMEGHR